MGKTCKNCEWHTVPDWLGGDYCTHCAPDEKKPFARGWWIPVGLLIGFMVIGGGVAWLV